MAEVERGDLLVAHELLPQRTGVRQLDEDIDTAEETETPAAPDPETRRQSLGIVRASELDAPQGGPASPGKPASRPAFRVIKGGKDDA